MSGCCVLASTNSRSALVREVALAEVDEAPARGEELLLPDVIRARLPPREVAALEHLARPRDRARERVARAGGLARVVEVRREEVRHQHAVDRVGAGGGLARVARLDQELDLALPGLGRAAGRGPPAEGVDEHLERLVAGRQRPAVAVLHQGVGAAVAVEVEPGRALDVVDDDDRPVAGRHRAQRRERVDGRGDRPQRREVAGGLLGERGRHVREVGRRRTPRVGDERDLDREHRLRTGRRRSSGGPCVPPVVLGPTWRTSTWRTRPFWAKWPMPEKTFSSATSEKCGSVWSGSIALPKLCWLIDAPRLKSRKPERIPIGCPTLARSASSPATSSRWVRIQPECEEANSLNLKCAEERPPCAALKRNASAVFSPTSPSTMQRRPRRVAEEAALEVLDRLGGLAARACRRP